MFKKQQGVSLIIKDTERIKEYAQGQYKEALKKINNVSIQYIFD